MKNLIEVSATTDEFKDHLDVLMCFLNSASALFGIACDGYAGKNCECFWNYHFVTAFFLFRHSIELAIKALIKEIKNIDVRGHNIKKMWEEHIPDYQNVLPNEIKKAFEVLEKYNILEDAQLFRYHTDKTGTRLENMPSIKNEDFDALQHAAWSIRQTVLECIHVKKGLPI